MPRRPRIAPGGLVYHVLNRAVARLALFEKEADYEAFERVLAEQRHRCVIDVGVWVLGTQIISLERSLVVVMLPSCRVR
jgi:putative transposase